MQDSTLFLGIVWNTALGANTPFIFWTVVKVVFVFSVLMGGVAYSVLAERKISALIQNRQGPNRVALPLIGSIPILGPFLTRLGIWQPMVDGLKSFMKEDFVPGHVKKFYFWIAPAIVIIPAVMTVAVLPFGSNINGVPLVIANLNVGVLYTFGIVSMGVYGIVLAGYASNSNYPFLGGIRSSAQMISYEISMGLSVIPVFMIVGSLNLSDVIAYQANHCWLILEQPIGFIIFLIAAFAETNRQPFDLAECETELVAGYNTEYSSMKFALFFMGEYASMIAASGMITTLFLGGWTLPFGGLDHPSASVLTGIVGVLVFMAKVGVLMATFIWVRWMLPRFRYDQLMHLGWKRLVPLTLANILVTAVLIFILETRKAG